MNVFKPATKKSLMVRLKDSYEEGRIKLDDIKKYAGRVLDLLKGNKITTGNELINCPVNLLRVRGTDHKVLIDSTRETPVKENEPWKVFSRLSYIIYFRGDEFIVPLQARLDTNSQYNEIIVRCRDSIEGYVQQTSRDSLKNLRQDRIQETGGFEAILQELKKLAGRKEQN